MNKELEIWQFAAERLGRGERLMLLVVAESSGSSPGRQGFKMIVAADDMRGSIGGGVMEVNLVEHAKLKIKNEALKSVSQIIEQIHRKNFVQSSGMICSGKQTVIFYELSEIDEPLVRKILRYVRNNRDRYFRLTSSALTISAKKIPAFDFNFENRGENDFLYEEKLGFKNKLFIIGGGHCALALSELMAKINFHISLFDDRSDLNTLAKNEYAHHKQTIDSYESIGEFVAPGANVYVVVMTLGYRYDEIVIRRLIGRDFKYFGVLGSRAKIKTLLKTFEKEGFAREKLDKIRAPVGLPINSQTPEEIAVSIAAEIIAVKNSKKQL